MSEVALYAALVTYISEPLSQILPCEALLLSGCKPCFEDSDSTESRVLCALLDLLSSLSYLSAWFVFIGFTWKEFENIEIIYDILKL